MQIIWDLKFMNCPTHKIHTIECPKNENDFTVFENSLILYHVCFVLTEVPAGG